MIGLDTNVLLRLFTADDTEQTNAALEFIDEQGDASIYISVIVLVEFAWTLRRFYKLEKKQIAAAIEALLTRRELVIEGRPEVMTALKQWKAGKADFSDYFLASLNKAQGAMPTYTFDRDAGDGDMFILIES